MIVQITDFLEAPFTGSCEQIHLEPHGSEAKDVAAVRYMCCRPHGHFGVHAHPDLDHTWGYALDVNKDEARVEILIAAGKVAKAVGVNINGWPVPMVRDVTVEYGVDQPRTVIIEILATDIVEVPDTVEF